MKKFSEFCNEASLSFWFACEGLAIAAVVIAAVAGNWPAAIVGLVSVFGLSGVLMNELR